MLPLKKAGIVAELQADLLRLQGFKSLNNNLLNTNLGPLSEAFHNGSFPLGVLHEFLSSIPEDTAATSGFIAGLLSSLMGNHGTALWISSSRTIFPPALKCFGLQPERFVFVDLKNEKEVIWALDEAMKCGALSAVVGEVPEISFRLSRRLQLAVERSEITGFIHRYHYRHTNTTACVTRWNISPMPSESPDQLPGIGFPKWRVALERIRNGKTGVWEIQWIEGKFVSARIEPEIIQHTGLVEEHKKAG